MSDGMTDDTSDKMNPIIAEEAHHFYVTIGEAIRPEAKFGISLTFPSDADPRVSCDSPLPVSEVLLPFACRSLSILPEIILSNFH